MFGYGSNSLTQSLIVLVVLIAIFLIFRELVCWYWKINERLNCLKDIRDLLQKKHDLMIKNSEKEQIIIDCLNDLQDLSQKKYSLMTDNSKKEQTINDKNIKPTVKNLIVTEISPDSQAEKLGIKIGDIIVSYDGASISSDNDLSMAISRAKQHKKDHAEVVILRNGKKGKLKVTLEPLGIICTEDKLGS